LSLTFATKLDVLCAFCGVFFAFGFRVLAFC